MAWINKLSRQNYVVRRLGELNVVVENQRNQERTFVPVGVLTDLVLRHGFDLSDRHIVDDCIDRALIPHPYDEYV